MHEWEVGITAKELLELEDQHIEDLEDVAGLAGEAELALNWFGIKVKEIEPDEEGLLTPEDVVLIFDDPTPIGMTPVGWVDRCQKILDLAITILDQGTMPGETPESAIKLLRSNEESPETIALAINYYFAMMNGHGTDGAFDYHGSYVDILLKAMKEILEKRGGE